jgi:pimeloyl-ACP methyl ester carboxylesterase
VAADETHLVEVDGINLRCLDRGRGDGPTIVLLHGFGLSLSSWSRLVPLLTDRSRVVAIDRPGFGGSDRPDPGRHELAPSYTSVGAALLTTRALRVLDVERAVLVGHSAGAEVAIAAAGDPVVSGLVLLAPVLGSAPPLVRRLAGLPGAGTLGPLLLRRLGPAGARSALRRLWPEPLDAATEAALLEPFTVAGWERPLWAMTRHQAAVHAGVDPTTVGVPALVVACGADRIAPPAAVAELSAALPGSRLVHLDDCGHLPQQQRPTEVAALIRDLVGELPSGATSEAPDPPG